MPVDLAALVQTEHVALITLECQRGVVGDLSALPELARAAAHGSMLENVARLVEAARAVGVPIVHCTAERREDGLGANANSRLFQYMARAEPKLTPGSPAAEIVPEVPLAASDIVLPRLHGLSPFHGTELDFVLRNLGVRTVVGVGVSVNVAVTNFAFDAVNASYQVVLPRDAVAGFPQEYVEAVFEHTLAAVSTLTTTDALLRVWRR